MSIKNSDLSIKLLRQFPKKVKLFERNYKLLINPVVLSKNEIYDINRKI